MLIVRRDPSGPQAQAAVAGVDMALGAALRASGAERVGVPILDRAVSLEHPSAERLAELGLQRAPAGRKAKVAS